MSASEQLESDLLSEVMSYARRDLDAVVGRCESPIERVMAAALLRQFNAWPEIGTFAKRDRPWTVPGMVEGEYPAARYMHLASGALVVLIPQLPLALDAGSYRLDFALLAFEPDYKALRQCVAIECDGHDFHDRTKEQASRDRARDRALQSAGWKVLRFTGRDIVSDPVSAADEAVRFVMPVSNPPPAAKVGTARAEAKRPRVTRERLLLPGPAVDALALLIGFPELAGIAEDENLPGLMPPGPLADLARDLIRGPIPPDVIAARTVAVGLTSTDARRMGEIVQAAGSDVQLATREFRRSCVRTKLERLGVEMGEAERRVVLAGAAAVDDLSLQYQKLVNVKRELTKRLRELERGDN